MDNLQSFLQSSAKLYEHLANTPKGEERDAYIEEIHSQLDTRDALAQQLVLDGFKVDSENKQHQVLIELDKGIRERLQLIKKAVQVDLKDVQNSKKNEQQYMNPYSDVQVMDGMYYDKKK